MESQHLEDIEIPVIEIGDDWTVDDIKTIADCEDAFAFLMAAVAEIEYELELKELGVCRFADPTWPARARRALKYKKTALQIVSQKRGTIERDRRAAQQANADRILLDHIKIQLGPKRFHDLVVSSGVITLEAAA